MRYIVITTLAACLAWATAANAIADDLEKLTKDIGSSDKEVCLCAIDDLGKRGADAKSAVPELVKALCCEDGEICWHAARTLGSIGPDAKAAVPALVKALDHDDPNVRAYAAYALGKVGSDSDDVVDALINKAFDKSLPVRKACLGALRTINPPVEKTLPVVLKILDEADPAIVLPALNTVAEEGKKAVPRLCEVLKHEKGCYWACLVLAEIGPDAKDAVPLVKDLLKREDPDVRLQALVTLGEIGPASKTAVPDIVKALETDEFEGVRYAAAFALGKIGLDAGATKALTKAAESDDPFMEMISVWALALNNPGDKAMIERAVKLIVGAFKSDDVHLRRLAAKAAVDFDVPREDVVPALIDALRDKDPRVVGNAIEALAELGPKALQHVGESLKNEELRPFAVRLIQRMGPQAESAVPALIAALGQESKTEDDWLFRREVQFALAAIGPQARGAVPALIASLGSKREEIRASACFALGRIGPGAVAAVSNLRNMDQDESHMVRLAALFALVKIQRERPALARRVVPELLKALGSDDERYRAGAALALGELSGQLGELGKRAVPRLKQLLKDESPLVREVAAGALEKLGG